MGISLTDTVNLLQKWHGNVSGIEHAPRLDEYPRGELARSDLPCVLVFPQEGIMNNKFGIGCRSEERDYNIMVLVADTGTGIQTDWLPEITRLIDEFHELYNGNSISNDSSGNLHVEIGENAPEDTGVNDEIIFADTQYFGFQLTVRIWRKAST